jgi:hypothetical protein
VWSDGTDAVLVAVVASSDANVTNGSPLNPDVTGKFRQTVPDAIDAARAHR